MTNDNSKRKGNMQHIKIILEDSKYNYETQCNGTHQEIREYFVNKLFNFGLDADKLIRCVDVQFLGEC